MTVHPKFFSIRWIVGADLCDGEAVERIRCDITAPDGRFHRFVYSDRDSGSTDLVHPDRALAAILERFGLAGVIHMHAEYLQQRPGEDSVRFSVRAEGAEGFVLDLPYRTLEPRDAPDAIAAVLRAVGYEIDIEVLDTDTATR